MAVSRSWDLGAVTCRSLALTSPKYLAAGTARPETLLRGRRDLRTGQDPDARATRSGWKTKTKGDSGRSHSIARNARAVFTLTGLPVLPFSAASSPDA